MINSITNYNFYDSLKNTPDHRLSTLLKKTLQHRYISVNIAKFLRIPMNKICERLSLQGEFHPNSSIYTFISSQVNKTNVSKPASFTVN